MPITLNFSEIKTIRILAGQSADIAVNDTFVWKIESAGIGGSNGSVVLLDILLPSGQQEIAVLYNAGNENTSTVELPYWLEHGFQGSLSNESTYTASVSITVYEILG